MRLMVSLFAALLLSVSVCCGQTDTPAVDDWQKVRIYDIVKKGKRYHKLYIKAVVPRKCPALQCYLSKQMFGRDTTAFTSLMNEYINGFKFEKNNYEKNMRAMRNPINLSFEILMHEPGRYMSCLVKVKRDSIDIVKNIIYDIRHDKVLGMSDIFTSRALAVRRISDKERDLALSDSLLVYGCDVFESAGRQKEVGLVDCYDEFTADFKEILGDDVAERARIAAKDKKTYDVVEVMSTEEGGESIKASEVMTDSTKTCDVAEVMPTEEGGEFIKASEVMTDSKKTYDIVEVMPTFPGGDAAFMNWLSCHIKYPALAEEEGIQGRVIVRFVVGEDGSISNASVVESVDPALDKEALRVVNSMPRWIPGTQNDKPVPVWFTQPVTFTLQ